MFIQPNYENSLDSEGNLSKDKINENVKDSVEALKKLELMTSVRVSFEQYATKRQEFLDNVINSPLSLNYSNSIVFVDIFP